MDIILARCAKCGSVFKITSSYVVDEDINYITDLGGVLKSQGDGNYTCINCKNGFNISENFKIVEDWIADMVFRIKGN